MTKLMLAFGLLLVIVSIILIAIAQDVSTIILAVVGSVVGLVAIYLDEI